MQYRELYLSCFILNDIVMQHLKNKIFEEEKKSLSIYLEIIPAKES